MKAAPAEPTPPENMKSVTFCFHHFRKNLMVNTRRRLQLILVLGVFFLVFMRFSRKLDVRNVPRVVTAPPSASSSASASAAEPLWEDPGLYHVSYPRGYKFIMDDTPACKSRTPFLVLVVPVAPGNKEARDAIRKTWGSEELVLGQLVETVFMLGLPGGPDAEQQQEDLRQENRQHQDLIQSDFQDSYRNLTIKTMMMLEWLDAHCAGVSYVVKIDSDMLLHVPNMVRLLGDPQTAERNYMSGLVWWHSPVLRNPLNKFYIPKEVFAEDEYPPYPLGMTYVMSSDLPGKILRVAPQIKALYIEDVYLGMCLKRLGIPPTDPPEETMFIVTPRHPLSDCSLSKVITVTTTSIPQMIGYWERSRQPEAKC